MSEKTNLTPEQIAEAEAKKAAAQEKAAVDKAAKAADNDISKTLAAMQKRMDALEKQNKDQAKIIGSIKKNSKEVAEVKPPQIPKDSVKSGKKEYRFSVAAFTFGQTKYISEDASLDQEVIDAIVGIDGQGILVEVH